MGMERSRPMRKGTRPLPLSVQLLAAALLASAGGLKAQPLTITHLAGTAGDSGWIDGTGSAARFSEPGSVAVDGSGNVYVADTLNHTIRKIVVSTGEVFTLAGLAGSSGSADGPGSGARFLSPSGVAADGSGDVYVADTGNHAIRKIVAATGAVTTLAGLAGSSGSTDGTGSAARFFSPRGIAVDGSGNVYVADTANYTIRMITPAGIVTTLAGMAGRWGDTDGTGSAAQFKGPAGVTVDGSGNVFVADTSGSTIRKILVATGSVTTLAGYWLSGSTDGVGVSARFKNPAGIAADTSGNVFVADTENNTIRKIVVATGSVTTLAGLAGDWWGSADGTGSAARFYYPNGVAVDGFGNLFVADTRDNSIRKIVLATRAVTTLAGLARASGSSDGPGTAARFFWPEDVAADGSGNVYVTDIMNSTIRKIVVATGSVTTVAGLAGNVGSADGIGNASRFRGPWAIAADKSGNLYVTDAANHTIRKITAATGSVTTLAGLAGSVGSADGTGSAARFNFPEGVAVDSSGNVYVADSNNNTIRKIAAATKTVSTLAGLAGSSGSADGAGSAARFNGPMGIAADGLGNLYVADKDNSTIRRIVVSTGEVTTLAGLAGQNGSADGIGNAARFDGPWSVASDGSGSLFVADTVSGTIRKIVAATGSVTTVAGLAGSVGSADGVGSAARFRWPTGVAADGFGNVFVADRENNCIRKGSVTASFADAATIDSSTGLTGQVRQLDTSPQTGTKWFWEQVRRPSGSTATLSSAAIRNPTFSPDVPDLYVFRLTASDESGAQSITTVSLTATSAFAAPPLSRILPTVVDVSSGSIHYTTEMALTNNTSTTLSVSILYTASLGSKQGSGTVTDSLAPGEQKKVIDALSYLRDRGLAIPTSTEQPQQGGTLLVTFQGSDEIDPRLVSVTARTAALTSAPHPVGRAGLAYSGLLDTESSTSSLTLYGLRSTPTDRTNVAVFNTSGDPVTLKVTVCSGTGDGRCVIHKDAETLSAYGWVQYGSNQILSGNGIAKGWAIVERTSATGSFSAYAVINDFATNDGSFVPPTQGGMSGQGLTVPVLSETPFFRSELVLANKSASPVTLTLNYVESYSPSSGIGGTMTVTLGPMEEQIIPEAIDFLRKGGVNIGPKDAATYVGALRLSVFGTTIDNVFAGARTASQSPAPVGGQFGLFTPCIYSGQEAAYNADLYGLRTDSENRTNVAVVNTGTASDGPILLQLQAYDGDAGGVPRGEPFTVSLLPGAWSQPPNFFRNSGVANGWVKVTRMSGSAPWIAYGVVNDGGNPNERTGDGAYVPMTK